MQHACVRATPEKARLTTPVRGGEILAVRASLDWSSEFSSDNAREVLFNGRTTYVATSSPPRQKADDNEGDVWQLQWRRSEGALHATRVALAAALRDLRRLQQKRDGGREVRENLSALEEAKGAPSLDCGTVVEPDYRHSVILALLGQRRSTRHVIPIPHPPRPLLLRR
jgi:hypothetical protein